MISCLTIAILCFGPSWQYVTSGTASWYSRESSGIITASGAPMIDSKRICAMRWGAFGTRLRVTNTENNRTAYCTLLDRGPYYAGRVLDVSPAVRDDLGFSGTTHVVIYREIP